MPPHHVFDIALIAHNIVEDHQDKKWYVAALFTTTR